MARLSCLHGSLAQGSPASPVLSNLCFAEMDVALFDIALRYGATLSRYADDIVFSGRGAQPVGLRDAVQGLFLVGPWRLSEKKERCEPQKGRIKVHGLIVNGDRVRLTKGYRNKLRAFRHVLERGVEPTNRSILQGHLRYSEHVQERLTQLAANISSAPTLLLPEIPMPEAAALIVRPESIQPQFDAPADTVASSEVSVGTPSQSIWRSFVNWLTGR